MAAGTQFRTVSRYLFLTTQGRFFKRYGQCIFKVSTTPGSAPGSRRPAEESVKDIPEAPEIEVNATKAPAKESLQTFVPKTVIIRPSLRIGEHLVSFVNFFEFLGAPILTITVGVVLKSQLSESPFYLLMGSIPGYSQHLIIITFRCHL